MTAQRRSDVPPIERWDRLLDGRVAVATGGADGIGGAIARLFAEHGALVEVADIDVPGAERTARAIGEHGGVARAHTVDVTSADDVDRFGADVLSRHGRVDVLVNNVGDYRPLVPFAESGPASWKAMYDINLLHVLAVTRAFIGPMTDQGRGSIVNVHSVEGMRAFPPEPVYGAMKAAVAHFTSSLAVSVGRSGVRVNGMGPDLTQTPQVDYLAGVHAATKADSGADDEADSQADDDRADALWAAWAPVGRLGWPEDQARVALFLASDLSAYVTGHNIPVDGGTRAGGRWFYSPTAGRFVNRPRRL
jgi:NAD(P)-dependent dehydrogenase (short-subunit alcohol dehydrogenase family)